MIQDNSTLPLSRVRELTSTVFQLARNAALDVRFGPPLAATYLRNPKQSNSDYRTLEAIFDGRISNGDVLVDVGCGAGRVINQWLRSGITSPIHGLEADERLAAFTRRRLRRRANVSIVVGDAVEHLPADGTVFFLFNPFGRPTMDRFAAAVLAQAAAKGAAVTVIYQNSKHLGAFEDDTRFVVTEVAPSDCKQPGDQPLAIITVNPA